jgi:hypothetical protein
VGNDLIAYVSLFKARAFPHLRADLFDVSNFIVPLGFDRLEGAFVGNTISILYG